MKTKSKTHQKENVNNDSLRIHEMIQAFDIEGTPKQIAMDMLSILNAMNVRMNGIEADLQRRNTTDGPGMTNDELAEAIEQARNLMSRSSTKEIMWGMLQNHFFSLIEQQRKRAAK